VRLALPPWNRPVRVAALTVWQRLCHQNKMTVPALFGQFAFFRAVCGFRGLRSCFFTLCTHAKTLYFSFVIPCKPFSKKLICAIE
jgi:hypothetical protein